MPTWDVVPTGPEGPVFGLDSAPPSPLSVHDDLDVELPFVESTVLAAEPDMPAMEPPTAPAAVSATEPLVPPACEPSATLALKPSAAPTLEPFALTPKPAVPPPPPVVSAPVQRQVDFTYSDIPPMAAAKSIDDALRTVVMTRLLRDTQTREELVQPILMENLSLAPAVSEVYTSKTQDQLIAEQAKPVEPVENVPVSGRTTRRSAATLGDTVRSDLEMEQIIASLGYDEAMDPNILSTRNLAIIPDMISVTGETGYAYDDTNHLVENPSEYFAPCTGIHDWTDKEKEIFLDKYAAFPKQFGLIAESLPNKTASQCIDYYYLHKKKIIDFRRAVSQLAPNKRGRRRTGRQKGNGLLSDIRQHDAEVHGDFDDSPSYTARPTRGRRIVAPEPRKPSGRRNAFQLDDATTATPTPEPEARPKRRRAAASSRSVLFQDDMDDDDDGEPKKKKRGRKPKSAATILDDFATPIPTPPPTADVDDFPIPEAPVQLWSSDDKVLFQTLLAQHGENLKRISVFMPNKTSTQVAEYFKANRAELDLASVLPRPETASDASVPVSGRTSPDNMAPWPAPPLQTKFERRAGANVVVASPVLDPNAMWDSMDPGSAARSPMPEPRERVSPASETDSSDRDRASGVVVLPAPPMAFLTREPSRVEVDCSESRSRPIPSPSASVSASSASTPAENDTATADEPVVKPEASEKDAEQLKYSSNVTLAYDPIWGAYYDPNGATFGIIPLTAAHQRTHIHPAGWCRTAPEYIPLPASTHELLCHAVSVLYTPALSLCLIPHPYSSSHKS
ncbi:hypothetical protein K438DRAFT_1831967 [Mycena galopus ATCC 62051]|nr:hypothetical protein K438DRAFT_1831967 [Mycena galopus ATCC 62051]